jgi:hypothetical protein
VPETPQPPLDAERPSKSQRKRDAHALQDLAVSLVELGDSELRACRCRMSCVKPFWRRDG